MSALKPDATASTSSAVPDTLEGRGDLRIVNMKSFNSWEVGPAVRSC